MRAVSVNCTVNFNGACAIGDVRCAGRLRNDTCGIFRGSVNRAVDREILNSRAVNVIEQGAIFGCGVVVDGDFLAVAVEGAFELVSARADMNLVFRVENNVIRELES